MATSRCSMATLPWGKMKTQPQRTRHFDFPGLKMTCSAINPPRSILKGRRIVVGKMVSFSTAEASEVFDEINDADAEESYYTSGGDSGFSHNTFPIERPSIVVIGISIDTAPIELLEKLALPEVEWPWAISELCSLNHVQEAAVLATANRIEIYIVALSVNGGVREVTAWMSKTSGIPVEEISIHRFLLYNNDAIQHLFHYSVGLNSLAILEQVVNIGQGVLGFGRTLSALFKHTILFSKGVGDVDELREATIPAETNEFAAWRDSLGTVATIRKLIGYGENIRGAEVEKWLGKMGGDVPMETRRAMEDLSRAIVGRLLHGPMKILRSDGEDSHNLGETVENVNALNRMFDYKS